jgi:hypothetical protein
MMACVKPLVSSQVMYLKPQDGESGLPTPQTAFVPTTHVKSL